MILGYLLCFVILVGVLLGGVRIGIGVGTRRGRTLGMKEIAYQPVECYHVWGNWEIAHTVVDGKKTEASWGQRRSCTLCNFTEWRQRGK